MSTDKILVVFNLIHVLIHIFHLHPITPLSSFQITIFLDLITTALPLFSAAWIVLSVVIACWANLFKLFSVVKNLFASVERYISSRWRPLFRNIFKGLVAHSLKIKSLLKNLRVFTLMELGSAGDNFTKLIIYSGHFSICAQFFLGEVSILTLRWTNS